MLLMSFAECEYNIGEPKSFEGSRCTMEWPITSLFLVLTVLGEVAVFEVQNRTNVGSSDTSVFNLTSHPFIDKLFNKYGHDDWMSFEGFEHLLVSLGLGHLVIHDHDISVHKEGDKFKEIHPHHEHFEDQQNQSKQDVAHEHGSHDEHQHHKHQKRKKRAVDLKKVIVENYNLTVLDIDSV